MDAGIDLEQLINALYLSSPALPIGAYSYSQGIEAAVEANIVHSETEVGEWILDGLREIVGPGEAAAVAWQHRFWTAKQFIEMQRLNAWFLTSRETAELRQETEQMGWSLTRMAADSYRGLSKLARRTKPPGVEQPRRHRVSHSIRFCRCGQRSINRHRPG